MLSNLSLLCCGCSSCSEGGVYRRICFCNCPAAVTTFTNMVRGPINTTVIMNCSWLHRNGPCDHHVTKIFAVSAGLYLRRTKSWICRAEISIVLIRSPFSVVNMYVVIEGKSSAAAVAACWIALVALSTCPTDVILFYTQFTVTNSTMFIHCWNDTIRKVGILFNGAAGLRKARFGF